MHGWKLTKTLQEGALFEEQGKMTVSCAIGIILTEDIAATTAPKTLLKR